MQTLEEEAQEYFSKDNGLYCAYSVKNKEEKFTSVVSEVRAIDFVKESKWVQAEMIKAQIDAYLHCIPFIDDEEYRGIIRKRIDIGEQLLKQLEDEEG